jgi:hypothetical protein
MHASALNLTTKVTGAERVLFVCLPQRGAGAELARALDAWKRALRTCTKSQGTDWKKRSSGVAFSIRGRRQHRSRSVNIRAGELVSWRQVGRGG